MSGCPNSDKSWASDWQGIPASTWSKPWPTLLDKTHYPHARHTYLIAEVGSCWKDRLPNALTLQTLSPLDTAKAYVQYARGLECDAVWGMNAVKFQYFSSAQAVAAKRRAPHLAEMYDAYRMPAEFLAPLAEEAKRWGVDFLCSTYLLDDIPTVAPYVTAFKIASFDALDNEFF